MSNSEFNGININDASPAIIKCKIYENYRGINISGTSNPVIGGNEDDRNDIYANSDSGVNSTSSTTINAQYNWWGDDTGPYHATANPLGEGNKVSDNVDFDHYIVLHHAPTIKVDQNSQTGEAVSASNDGSTAAVKYSAEVSAWFEDEDTGDTLTYALVSAKDANNTDVSEDVILNTATGSIEYTPATAQAEKDVTIEVKAYDGSADSTSNVTIIVTVGTVPADTAIDECFIATAAFGSKFDEPVALLRHFRDQYLLTNHTGTAFVNFYYRHSPPIAAIITSSQPLKVLVRVMLAPIIAIVYIIYHPVCAVLLVLLIGLYVYRTKQPKRRLQS